MIIYPISEEILNRLKHLRSDLHGILKNELKLEVKGNFFKFYNHYYPINIKFFEQGGNDKDIMGRFQRENHQISINYLYYKDLPRESQLNILRHEIAHYIDYILRGDQAWGHDTHYKDLCKSYGWTEEVYLSTMKDDALIDIQKNIKNRKRFQKLISLSQNNASWQEAETALLMARKIMSEKFLLEPNNTEQACFDYVAIELAIGKRMTQKYQTIALLLENFSCKTIFKTYPGHFTLEAICHKSETDAISELFTFFNEQIDQWYLECRENNSKLHRQSFYKGLRLGLEEKIQHEQRTYYPHQKALIKNEELKLQRSFALLYPRSSKVSSSSKLDSHSYHQGMLVGKRLELKNKLSQTMRFLEYFK